MIKKEFNWGTIGLIIYIVMLLLMTMILGVSGDYVLWFAASSLPLLLPLTLGTKMQKIIASVFFVFSLYLICDDNEAGKEHFRRRAISVNEKMHELEDKLEAIKEKKKSHNEVPVDQHSALQKNNGRE